MTVKARMLCSGKTEQGEGALVTFTAVYDPDKNSPNYSFSLYTPSASLSMYITNPTALAEFEPGTLYDLDFNKTDLTPFEPEDTSTPDDGVRDNPAEDLSERASAEEGFSVTKSDSEEEA